MWCSFLSYLPLRGRLRRASRLFAFPFPATRQSFSVPHLVTSDFALDFRPVAVFDVLFFSFGCFTLLLTDILNSPYWVTV